MDPNLVAEAVIAIVSLVVGGGAVAGANYAARHRQKMRELAEPEVDGKSPIVLARRSVDEIRREARVERMVEELIADVKKLSESIDSLHKRVMRAERRARDNSLRLARLERVVGDDSVPIDIAGVDADDKPGESHSG